MRTTTLCFGAAFATAIGLLSDLVLAEEPSNQQIISRNFLQSTNARTFAIEYAGTVSSVPAGARQLRVWMPVPQNSTVQTIHGLSFTKAPRLSVEPKYGNLVAYWAIDHPPSSLKITMRFVCTRQEAVVDMAQLRSDGQDAPDQFQAFKDPDKLVIVDDEIRRLSDRIIAGRESTLEKARAIYEYVLAKMTYDKSDPGWGLGSTRHACEFGKGNCTDFHALFNSLCRAQGIASGFEIGLYLPYEVNQVEPLGSYHCWAFFRVPGKTWVPVDCSEGARFPARRAFFFGGHTDNRVALSTGRDILLEPRQAGEALNYFLQPYAEADDKPVQTDKAWSFRQVASNDRPE